MSTDSTDSTAGSPEHLAALGGTAQHLDALTAALAERAHAEHLLDVSFTTVDSPIGGLLLAATERGVVRVAFEREGFDAILETLGTKIGPRTLRNPRALDTVARQLDEYFAGTRTEFDLELDLALSTPFRATVQRELTRIPFGQTRSYGEIAVAVGNPKAVRAVGTSCATNPLPLVIPCHRVLRTGGALGGYLGGLDTKRALLDLESSRNYAEKETLW